MRLVLMGDKIRQSLSVFDRFLTENSYTVRCAQMQEAAGSARVQGFVHRRNERADKLDGYLNTAIP